MAPLDRRTCELTCEPLPGAAYLAQHVAVHVGRRAMRHNLGGDVDAGELDGLQAAVRRGLALAARQIVLRAWRAGGRAGGYRRDTVW